MKPVLSHLCPHLTTIVTFLPNFSVVNSSNRSLRFMEDNQEADLWTDILQGQVIFFKVNFSFMFLIIMRLYYLRHYPSGLKLTR